MKTPIADLLLADGLLSPNILQAVQARIEQSGESEIDALISIGSISEKSLLSTLAGKFHMHFVSTSKLAQANVQPTVLRLIPRQVAKKLCAFPIMFDSHKELISVVIGNPFDHTMHKQLLMVSSAHQVQTFIARPAAIHAAIRKHYDRDLHAFTQLLSAQGPSTSLKPGQPVQYGYSGAMFSEDDFDPEKHRAAKPAASLPPPAPKSDPKISVPRQSALPRSSRAPSRSFPNIEAQSSTVAGHDYLETLNLLVAVTEQQREGLRGHSAQVARLSAKLCMRLQAKEEDAFAIQIAAYLHDLGKQSSYHLTALNVARFEGHASQAQKTYLAPVRLFESVRLPQATNNTLEHLYEHVDRRGFPDRLGGKDIPLGSRILAIAETFADLTNNPRNPYRRILSPEEAIAAIEQYTNTVFDADLVNLCRLEVQGDGLRAKLLRNKTRVLLVEPNLEEITTLQLRLMEHGYAVEIATDAKEAKRIADQNEIGLIISEIDLPAPTDGLQLQTDFRKSANTADVPVIFLTRRSDRESVNQGFQGGAKDFLVKPASADVVLAKALQALQTEIISADRSSKPQGIRGSLAEMALPDLVQVLSQSRKSGRLHIETQTATGDVFFSDGQVFHATCGDKNGDQAFYNLVVLAEGDFDFDPTAAIPERTIHSSAEMLLLEGMRLFDESSET